MNLNDNRFSRQADLVPRDKLKNIITTVIGVGAIGRQVSIQLAAIGVRQIQLIDFDTVEPTNITTQGYFHADLGREKVEATADLLLQIEPRIEINTIADRFRPSPKTGDVVFVCVDSIAARAAIWRSQRERCSFWCDGRMLGEVIRILTATGDSSRQYYATTLFSQAEAQTGTCTSRSTIYASNVAAGVMLHQFTRWLRDLPTNPDLTFNLLASECNIATSQS